MTEFGNLLLTDTAIRMSGEASNWDHYDFTNTTKVPHAGDLGGRFEAKCMETLMRLRHPTAEAQVEAADHTERKGQFVGLGYTVSNPAAPVRKRVLVFGNSFVERMPGWGAAMPMAATFGDMRFVWYPGVHLDVVRSWQPDLVIFQTCERFLSAPPHSY